MDLLSARANIEPIFLSISINLEFVLANDVGLKVVTIEESRSAIRELVQSSVRESGHRTPVRVLESPGVR